LSKVFLSYLLPRQVLVERQPPEEVLLFCGGPRDVVIFGYDARKSEIDRKEYYLF
jgi:hypothetical protein